jgi:hypothetical protein
MLEDIREKQAWGMEGRQPTAEELFRGGVPVVELKDYQSNPTIGPGGNVYVVNFDAVGLTDAASWLMFQSVLKQVFGLIQPGLAKEGSTFVFCTQRVDSSRSVAIICGIFSRLLYLPEVGSSPKWQLVLELVRRTQPTLLGPDDGGMVFAPYLTRWEESADAIVRREKEYKANIAPLLRLLNAPGAGGADSYVRTNSAGDFAAHSLWALVMKLDEVLVTNCLVVQVSDGTADTVGSTGRFLKFFVLLRKQRNGELPVKLFRLSDNRSSSRYAIAVLKEIAQLQDEIGGKGNLAVVTGTAEKLVSSGEPLILMLWRLSVVDCDDVTALELQQLQEVLTTPRVKSSLTSLHLLTCQDYACVQETVVKLGWSASLVCQVQGLKVVSGTYKTATLAKLTATSMPVPRPEPSGQLSQGKKKRTATPPPPPESGVASSVAGVVASRNFISSLKTKLSSGEKLICLPRAHYAVEEETPRKLPVGVTNITASLRMEHDAVASSTPEALASAFGVTAYFDQLSVCDKHTQLTVSLGCNVVMKSKNGIFCGAVMVAENVAAQCLVVLVGTTNGFRRGGKGAQRKAAVPSMRVQGIAPTELQFSAWASWAAAVGDDSSDEEPNKKKKQKPSSQHATCYTLEADEDASNAVKLFIGAVLSESNRSSSVYGLDIPVVLELPTASTTDSGYASTTVATPRAIRASRGVAITVPAAIIDQVAPNQKKTAIVDDATLASSTGAPEAAALQAATTIASLTSRNPNRAAAATQATTTASSVAAAKACGQPFFVGGPGCLGMLGVNGVCAVCGRPPPAGTMLPIDR